MAETDVIMPDKVSVMEELNLENDLCKKGVEEITSCSSKLLFAFFFLLQDETLDAKTLKDTSHSSIDDLETEDLYVKMKVKIISIRK